MEKYYVVENKKFLESIERDKRIRSERDNFIKRFFQKQGIDGIKYYFRGTGRVNVPFEERHKSSIRLYIEDTETNRKKFEKQLTNFHLQELVAFRKNSQISKKFQEACITEKIVVNFWETMPGDYFEELIMGGYSVQQFNYNGAMYLKMSTNTHKSITPEYEGFKEIKANEYYASLGKLEAVNKKGEGGQEDQ